MNKKRREIKVIKRLEEEKRRNYEVETDRKREEENSFLERPREKRRN